MNEPRHRALKLGKARVGFGEFLDILLDARFRFRLALVLGRIKLLLHCGIVALQLLDQLRLLRCHLVRLTAKDSGRHLMRVDAGIAKHLLNALELFLRVVAAEQLFKAGVAIQRILDGRAVLLC